MEKNAFRFLSISSTADFEAEALATFHRQYEFNKVYRSYCDLLNCSPAEIKTINAIPFLPIQFFKTHQVKCFEASPKITFRSSGTTTSINAQHRILDKTLYEKSFQKCFEDHYGNPKDWTILALLPSYLERQGSSLIYMMDALIKQSRQPDSGFYLNEFEQLYQLLQRLENSNNPRYY